MQLVGVPNWEKYRKGCWKPQRSILTQICRYWFTKLFQWNLQEVLKSFAARIRKVPVQASHSPLPSCCVKERASKERQHVDSQQSTGHSNVGNRKSAWCNYSSKFSPAAHPQGSRCCITRANQPQRSVAVPSQYNDECKNFSSASLAESYGIKKGLTCEKERMERMAEFKAWGCLR